MALAALVLAAGRIDAAEFRTGQPVMGTILQVTVVAHDAPRARMLAAAAVAEARRWDDILTTWRASGELARFNARAGSGPVPVSPDLAWALRRMHELAAATGGAFDPAVGAFVNLWRAPDPPAPERLAAIPIRQIATALSVGDGVATLEAGTVLDAGGIGKGMALDAALRVLRAGGAGAVFLDFGGSSQLAAGAPPENGRGWNVAIARLSAGDIRGVLPLRDGSLSTSRSTGPGEAAGPIVDPRDGRPLGVSRLATVWASDATTAEAWSKELIVLGRDGVARARSAGVDVLLEDADGAVATGRFEHLSL